MLKTIADTDRANPGAPTSTVRPPPAASPLSLSTRKGCQLFPPCPIDALHQPTGGYKGLDPSTLSDRQALPESLSRPFQQLMSLCRTGESAAFRTRSHYRARTTVPVTSP